MTLSVSAKDVDNLKVFKHIPFYCTHYNDPRIVMLNAIKAQCDSISFSKFISNPDYAISCLSGDRNDVYNIQFLIFIASAFNIRIDYV